MATKNYDRLVHKLMKVCSNFASSYMFYVWWPVDFVAAEKKKKQINKYLYFPNWDFQILSSMSTHTQTFSVKIDKNKFPKQKIDGKNIIIKQMKPAI